MKIKITAIAFLFILFSCNANNENKAKPASTETKSTSDDGTPATDIEAQKKALNDQSKACIALMNSLEVELNAAYAAGDAAAASNFKKRIDSAATENAKIGQQLMALDK
ncbi:MAG: hypothetical protein WBC06_17655 [Chitinophagaceae bacterium]